MAKKVKKRNSSTFKKGLGKRMEVAPKTRAEYASFFQNIKIDNVKDEEHKSMLNRWTTESNGFTNEAFLVAYFSEGTFEAMFTNINEFFPDAIGEVKEKPKMTSLVESVKKKQQKVNESRKSKNDEVVSKSETVNDADRVRLAEAAKAELEIIKLRLRLKMKK